MTKLGMRRTLPQIPLKSKTQLKAKKGLNRMSDKTKEELKIWRDIKHQRMQALELKFGYMPCEYCNQPTDNFSPFNYPEGHHNNHDRRDNRFENCRVVHRVCNSLIEDRNVKDVPSLL